MGLGENVRNQVSRVINDLGSTITIQTLDTTENAYGYTTDTTLLTSGTVKAVPSSFFKDRIGNQPMGNLNEGEVRMIFGGGTTFPNLIGTSSKWTAVMNVNNFTGTYLAKEQKPIILQDIEVAYPVNFVLVEEDGY